MAGRLSKEAVTSEFQGFYKPLSRRLYRVLEDIGASKSVRDITVKAMATREILLSMGLSVGINSALSCYFFGSSFEGTKTLGLKSDIDTVHVYEIPVVTNIAEAQPFCVLLVQDSCTPAGYSKLQCMIGVVPLTAKRMPFDILQCIYFSKDAEDRVVFAPQLSPPGRSLRNGPADTIEATSCSIANDIVDALRSCTWPNCASEWLVRERHYNWPSQGQIDKCKTLGCFFVQVGHPRSAEKHLQWRLSFSLQERLLVTNFNSVQLKCYILLKMIKKERIHKSLGEKSLTSYHFKTGMFYMIENTPAKFWIEENLLICLQCCLHQMLVWAETGVCPNYFIPEENMFDGRVSGPMRIQICEILRYILSADFRLLLNIEADMLGIRFQEARLPLGIIAPRHGQTASANLINSYAVYSSLLLLRNSFFGKCQNATSAICAQELIQVKHTILTTDSVSKHSVTETREALSLLLPYVDITLKSVQLIEAKRISARNEVLLNHLANEQWHVEADPISAKLKQASALCMLGYCELSLEVLLGLQDQLEQQIAVCGCHYIETPTQEFLELSLPVIPECSYDEFLHRRFIPCAVYLPAERDLTPPVLCYEMDRSVGFPAQNIRPRYDWAVVDGKILFYLLLYLNHDHLGMETKSLADFLNIRRLIISKEVLYHMDTAVNILGWIYKEKGLTAKAKKCFLESLESQPTHNAASLHLKEINGVL